MFEATEEDIKKIEQHKQYVIEDKKKQDEKKKKWQLNSQFNSQKSFTRKDFLEFLMPIIWNGGITLKVSMVSLAVLLLVS